MTAKKKKTASKGKAQKKKKIVSSTAAKPSRPQKKPGSKRRTADRTFYIVGIGASAGGLEALEEFFTNMPSNSGLAFILVTHLDPSRKSIMTDLLQKYTKMQVRQAEDKMKVKSDCVYIIPPNKDMALMKGALQLMEPQMRHGMRHPIDFFFRSLADDMGERAISIVLSGGGSDGTLGMQVIKGEGGMCMVQSIESSKYDGMPRNAIDSGLADFVLTPHKMPEQLIKFVKFSHVVSAKTPEPLMQKITDNLQKILLLIRNNTGHDFSYYKENTIVRRVERRMSIHQLARVQDYIKYLQQNPVETGLLFSELLIGVTNFFRDRDAFESLKKKALPMLLKNKRRDSPVRVWVPGCSTGEEAYSLAMVLKEYMDEQKKNAKVQIFATDINGEAVDKARTGIYPDSIVSDVSPERLNRFFMKGDNTFTIKKEIKEMVVFAVQNILKDPPFSKLDIVSCRNLMIYLHQSMQKRLLNLFQFVLNENGILFLGSSESAGSHTEYFSLIDKKWRIFKRTAVASRRIDAMKIPIFPLRGISEEQRTGKTVKHDKPLSEFVKDILLDKFSPATIIINTRNEVIFVHGHTGKYLELPSGEIRMNILEMAREGLKHELASAIRMASTRRKPVVRSNIPIKVNGGFEYSTLTVQTFDDPDRRNLKMVILESAPHHIKEEKEGQRSLSFKAGDAEKKITELQKELDANKEYLQTTIEELESSNEELQSTNEELNASNEELQSTNEELESSKEELQSVNEELVTVNAELQTKNEELSHAINDLNNLLISTKIAIIFLDMNLCVKRYTPEVTDIVSLIESDIGRPFVQIAVNLKDVSLLKDVQECIKTLATIEKEVESSKGIWFKMRVLPYRTVENVIDGVVITFTNITDVKRAEMLSRESEAKLAAICETKSEAIILVNQDGRVSFWNAEAERLFGYTSAEALGKELHTLIVSEKAATDYQKRFPRFKKTGQCRVVGKTLEMSAVKKDSTVIPVEITIKPIRIHGNWHAMGTVRARGAEVIKRKKTNKRRQGKRL